MDSPHAGRLAPPYLDLTRPKPSRLRPLLWCVLALVYAGFAQQLAARMAGVLAPGLLYDLLRGLIFLLLLLAGFAAMARVGQRQPAPLAAMGLASRPGFRQEFALGLALGWAAVVVAVLPLALRGGLLLTVSNHGLAAAVALVVDLLTLLLAALAGEIVFRGYPFQRLLEASGPVTASTLMTLLFAATRAGTLPPSAGSTLASLLLGSLLAMAYLRTRALWVGWAFRFAWSASIAVLFGLPLRDFTQVSPLYSTYSSGPIWLTGDGHGIESSLLAILVLLAMLFVLARATADLRHRWALPEIIGAAVPVDLDAARRRQHEQAMGPGAAEPPALLVQIAPAAPHPGDLPRSPSE